MYVKNAKMNKKQTPDIFLLKKVLQGEIFGL